MGSIFSILQKLKLVWYRKHNAFKVYFIIPVHIAMYPFQCFAPPLMSNTVFKNKYRELSYFRPFLLLAMFILFRFEVAVLIVVLSCSPMHWDFLHTCSLPLNWLLVER